MKASNVGTIKAWKRTHNEHINLFIQHMTINQSIARIIKQDSNVLHGQAKAMFHMRVTGNLRWYLLDEKVGCWTSKSHTGTKETVQKYKV